MSRPVGRNLGKLSTRFQRGWSALFAQFRSGDRAPHRQWRCIGDGAAPQLYGGRWLGDGADGARTRNGDVIGRRAELRSEEHTSELQSLMRLSYAVFCLKKQ